MDFLSNISNYLSELYQSAVEYFSSNSEAAPAPQAPAQTDQYRTVELREVQIQELIERSSQQRVPVGCYIQMHRVTDPREMRDAIRRQHP
ncbi:MAG TPA: hypothetical protein VJR29_05290 [bacterium]|nr:hypothetical protein [bacterium]